MINAIANKNGALPMNLIKTFFILILFVLLSSVNTIRNTDSKNLAESIPNYQVDSLWVLPVKHASHVLEWKNISIYVDPVGGASLYSEFDEPDIILITDIHTDHFDINTIDGLDTSNARIVLPQAVADSMPASYLPIMDILNNNESVTINNTTIQAIPMYNIRPEALQYHPQGRGNGYLLDRNGNRVYISGDTEDTAEMRALQNVDAAIVCMNLPYTMSIDSAASAVLEFFPDQVYPYHYKGDSGFSDVAAFKNIVETANSYIEVVQLDWYPGETH